MNDILTDYGNGIYAIDSDYYAPVIAAIHLVVESGRVALVDTAHNDAVPRVLSEMDKLGLKPENVDYVLLTHVHLDHAGGAGAFMAQFPNAKLVVHPRGARHMIDPSKLEAAVHEVYGKEEALRMYGMLVPTPAERVIEATHGMTLSLAGREFTFYDAPGHAKHHVVIRDGKTGHVFTGDTFGISYRHLDAGGRQFIFPTSSPSQFDARDMHNTVSMIADLKPEAVYLTHYAQVTQVPKMAEDMHRLIDAYAAIALRERQGGGAERHGRIKKALQDLYLQEAAREGWALQGDELLKFVELDAELNAQGLGIWVDGQPA
ncbi:MAG: MBL fold metallo-hydrolase [Rhodocyclaceae bacterium]|nr:MAG: MBL fold metallo-hydrolase [Rhodocyclaceae bacterium]